METLLAEGYCNGDPGVKFIPTGEDLPDMPVYESVAPAGSARVKIFGQLDEYGELVSAKTIQCPYIREDGVCKLRAGRFFKEQCLWKDPLFRPEELPIAIVIEEHLLPAERNPRGVLSLLKKIFK